MNLSASKNRDVDTMQQWNTVEIISLHYFLKAQRAKNFEFAKCELEAIFRPKIQNFNVLKSSRMKLISSTKDPKY